MEETKTDNKIYFPYLDVVRFIAAFMIIIVHAYEAWCGWWNLPGILTGGTYKEFTFVGKFINQFINNFGIGVDVFFLISGFLITFILLEEKRRFGRINIVKFMMRRMLRIWPLYFFLIAITPFLVKWLGSESPNYWVNILFINNFDTIITQKWTYPFAHFWSICIEEHFYLFWPFLIALIPNKRLMHLFITIIILSIGFRLYSASSMSYPWFTLYLHTLSRIDVLIIGAIGAYYYQKKQFVINLDSKVRILIWLLLIVSFCIEPVTNWDGMFLASFKKYFYIGIFAILLLDYNFNVGFKHILKKKSFVHYLGKISYGIYMYGNILLLFIIKKIMYKFGITNMYLFFLIVFSLSIIIPIISYELMEKHFLKLNKYFTVIKTER